MKLLPVCVNIYGKLDDDAAAYFAMVEQVAARRGRPYCPDPGAPRTIADLVSLMAVLSSAHYAHWAYSQGRLTDC